MGAGEGNPPPPNYGKPWKFGQMLGKIKKNRADLFGNMLNSGNFIIFLQKIRANFQLPPLRALAPYAYNCK
jgi:hypothetical protein